MRPAARRSGSGPARALAAARFALAVVLALAVRGRPAAAAGADADSGAYAYASVITTINKVGLAISNYGFLGNSFTNRSPSFEYPLGSGYEHMGRGGLWIGAHALGDTSAFTGVSAAVVDNSQGSNSIGETEFTPRGVSIAQSSRIANSRYWSPDAVSDQDLVCFYGDEPAKPASGFQRERHTPMRVLVRQTTYGFTLPAAESFVVVRFTLFNQGPPLRDLWVGLYTQLVSGNKNAYSIWPPSAAGGPGSWYYKVRAELDPSRSLYAEHFCQTDLNYPLNCRFNQVPPWAGVKYLRTTPPGPHDVTFHWWTYSPGDTARDTDTKRYAILSERVTMDPSACPIDGTCSPITVMGVGPFPELAPDDSLTVDFAFLGGEDRAALDKHADYAQFAASIDYRLPSAPPSPRLRVEVDEQAADLWWDDSPESVVDPASLIPGGKDFEGYRVYLGLDREQPTMVAQYDLVDTTGFNSGLDLARAPVPRVIDGVTYRYHRRIAGLKDGFRYWGAVTSYDTGDDATESLESSISQNKFLAVPNPAPGDSPAGIVVYPNPYRVETRWDEGRLVREHYLWFAGLPARCVLRIYTLSGDEVLEKRLDGESGRGARGIYDPVRDRDTGAPALSGSSFAWDLVTRRGQAAATGLYLWSVEDLSSGGFSRGKFLVVKSDRQ
jgi:hypothetical protein